jgi:hypothetical protein
MAPQKGSFSVSVVLPASGCDIIPRFFFYVFLLNSVYNVKWWQNKY